MASRLRVAAEDITTRPYVSVVGALSLPLAARTPCASARGGGGSGGVVALARSLGVCMTQL